MGQIPHARLDVLGIQVSSVSLDQAVNIISELVERKQSGYVTCTGMHGIMESRSDPALRDIHNQAALVTPDGMPLVWINQIQGRRHVTRVYGPDLMLAVCRRGVQGETAYRHFFYGGAPGVPEALADSLKSRFSGLIVAGTFSPPFRPLTPEEDRNVVETIRAARPDVVWVGLSTPKQERWMAEHTGRLRGVVLVGVGAAFDFHAGRIRQAPAWVQRGGLEWLFRLLMEPKRLWKRYLKNIPPFVVLTIIQMVGRSIRGVTARFNSDV